MKHGTRSAYCKGGCRCEECSQVASEYAKKYYKDNPERNKSRAKAHRVANRIKLNAIKLNIGCVDCGYRAHPAALDFDHLSDNKLFTIGQSTNRSWKNIKAEIEKCEVVCANCHRIRTAERLSS